MQKVIDWFNSDMGRRIVKWATTAFGLLITSGTIPMDTPLVLGMSLGQILTIFGLGIPSAPPQAVVQRQAFAALHDRSVSV